MRIAFTEKRHHRCEICYMHRKDCLCSVTPAVKTLSAITLVMHVSEVFKTTSTARLIPLAFPESVVHLRGVSKDFNHPFVDFLYSRKATLSEGVSKKASIQKLVLFPFEDARDIGDFTGEWSTGNVELLIPDGNWNQASRMIRREDRFAGATPVRIKDVSSGRFIFRRQAEKGRFSTFESLIRALEILEGEDAVAPLWEYLSEMHKRYVETKTKKIQGKLIYET